MTPQSVLESKGKKELKGKKKLNRKLLAIAGGSSVAFILVVVFIIIRFSKESVKKANATHRKVEVEGVTEDAANNGRDVAEAPLRPNLLRKKPVGKGEPAEVGKEDVEGAGNTASAGERRPELPQENNILLARYENGKPVLINLAKNPNDPIMDPKRGVELAKNPALHVRVPNKPIEHVIDPNKPADPAANPKMPAEIGLDAASDADRTGAEPEDNSNKPDALAKFPLPNDHRPPIPENVENAIKNLVVSVDDPDAFSKNLTELKRIVEVPDVLFGMEAENYAETLAEEYLLKEFKSVVVSDVSHEEINRALEVYHKVIEKTKADAQLPRNASEIKDVEVCRLAWKCMKEGKLSAEDKHQLENLLLSPGRSLVIPQSSSVFLGRKMETSSLEEAAASVKTYFAGSAQLKEDFFSYALVSENLERSDLEEYYPGEQFAMRQMHAECIAKIPRELKDEVLFRSGAKESLLDYIGTFQDLELLQCVNRNEIPTKEVIIAAINSPMFPKSDSLFMANFTRQLRFYIQDIARKQLETNQQMNRDAVGNVLKFCRSFTEKYIYLAESTPVDTRITSLKEWKDFVKDPTSLKLAAKIGKAVSDLGLETSSVSGYAMGWAMIKGFETGGYTNSFISVFISLFMFKFDQNDHPYYIMKEALFDINSDSFKQALTNFKAKKHYSTQERELMERINIYLANLK